MNTAGKVVIGLLVVGGIAAAVMLSSPSEAHAADKPPLPPPPVPPQPGPAVAPGSQPAGDAESGGIVTVPPLSQPGGGSVVVAPPPGPVPSSTPGGVTIPTPGGGSVTVPPSALPQVTQTPGGGTVVTLPGGGGQIALPAIPGAPTQAPTAPAGGGTISVPPLVVTAAGEPTAPADTIAVVQTMLGQEGNNTSWRSAAVPGLADWQRARGLGADSKFGMGTALRMAQEIGAIPIVRAWPTGSFREGHWLPDYKASLMQIAQTKTGAHRQLLEESAAREAGQGFGTPAKPILTPISLEG